MQKVPVSIMIAACFFSFYQNIALADPETLVCKIQPGTAFMQKLGWNGIYELVYLKVDAQASTVIGLNGVPYGFQGTAQATFTETEITWDNTVNGITSHYQLDRLTGYYSMWWDDRDFGPLQWNGPCKLGGQKF